MKGFQPYLYWIQKTPRKKQAWLREAKSKDTDTPEGFYHEEQGVKSTLLHRAKVRGLVKEKL